MTKPKREKKVFLTKNDNTLSSLVQKFLKDNNYTPFSHNGDEALNKTTDTPWNHNLDVRHQLPYWKKMTEQIFPKFNSFLAHVGSTKIVLMDLMGGSGEGVISRIQYFTDRNINIIGIDFPSAEELFKQNTKGEFIPLDLRYLPNIRKLDKLLKVLNLNGYTPAITCINGITYLSEKPQEALLEIIEQYPCFIVSLIGEHQVNIQMLISHFKHIWENIFMAATPIGKIYLPKQLPEKTLLDKIKVDLKSFQFGLDLTLGIFKTISKVGKQGKKIKNDDVDRLVKKGFHSISLEKEYSDIGVFDNTYKNKP